MNGQSEESRALPHRAAKGHTHSIVQVPHYLYYVKKCNLGTETNSVMN